MSLNDIVVKQDNTYLWLAISLPASLFTCWKPTVKFANDDHMTKGH